MQTEPHKLETHAIGKGRTILVCVGVVWILMGILDWGFRMVWFRWYEGVISPAIVAKSHESSTAQEMEIPARRGGDLTALLGIPDVIDEFAEEHSAFSERIDEHGYKNPPFDDSADFDIVVTGDSYMNAGDAVTNLFSVRLSKLAGIPVYNHATAGRGPHFSLLRFLEAERFKQEPPKLLIWGLIERDVSRDLIAGSMLWGVWNQMQAEIQEKEPSRIVWMALSPHALRKSLPNTSIIPQFSGRIWSRVRYAVFGQITPDVIASKGAFDGKNLLFYRYAIDALNMSDEERDIDRVIWGIEYLANYLREQRGIQLVIVLIPDKGRIHRDILPPKALGPDGRIPDSCLSAVEEGLEKKGIVCVNLLPAFQEQAANGELLYWADDTHWKPRAIQMAAELTWERIRNEL